MKHDDFSWDDIILEAPEDDFEEDELSASDYTDAEDMDIEEDNLEGGEEAGGGDDELAAADYTADEGEPAAGGEDPLAGDPADEDPLGGDETGGGEDPLAGDPADEDPLSEDDGDNKNPEEEQKDNAESDVVSDKQNKNLVNDFIELYNRIDTIMNFVRTDCKTNMRYNPNMLVVRRNMEQLKLITYDYIINKFTKETYVTNLYQFNLIIQALNVNIELLGSVLDSNRKLREGQEKNKKKPAQKQKKKR